MRDLQYVPTALRQTLENALAEDASPQALEGLLPNVRTIVIELLGGLRT